MSNRPCLLHIFREILTSGTCDIISDLEVTLGQSSNSTHGCDWTSYQRVLPRTDNTTLPTQIQHGSYNPTEAKSKTEINKKGKKKKKRKWGLPPVYIAMIVSNVVVMLGILIGVAVVRFCCCDDFWLSTTLLSSGGFQQFVVLIS